MAGEHERAQDTLAWIESNRRRAREERENRERRHVELIEARYKKAAQEERGRFFHEAAPAYQVGGGDQALACASCGSFVLRQLADDHVRFHLAVESTDRRIRTATATYGR